MSQNRVKETKNAIENMASSSSNSSSSSSKSPPSPPNTVPQFQPHHSTHFTPVSFLFVYWESYKEKNMRFWFSWSVFCLIKMERYVGCRFKNVTEKSKKKMEHQVFVRTRELLRSSTTQRPSTTILMVKTVNPPPRGARKLTAMPETKMGRCCATSAALTRARRSPWFL